MLHRAAALLALVFRAPGFPRGAGTLSSPALPRSAAAREAGASSPLDAQPSGAAREADASSPLDAQPSGAAREADASSPLDTQPSAAAREADASSPPDASPSGLPAGGIEPDPASSRWGWRVAQWALDLAILAGTFAAASWYRLGDLKSAGVLVDQFSHLRGAHEILFHQRVLQPPYFYTSAYLLLMAGYAAIFHAPRAALTAWTLTGALTAPLGALAARRLSGPLAGIAVGLVLAFHPMDALVTIGVKSPYFLSIFPALGMVGMAEGLHRKAWGPPLMAFGLAATVAMHLSLWPVGLVGVVLALGLAVWQGRPYSLRVVGTLAPTVALAAWLARWDARRLMREVRKIMIEGFPFHSNRSEGLRTTALKGLSLSPKLIPWLAGLAAAGLLGALLVAVARRSVRGRKWTTPAQARAIAGGAMALLLTTAGGAYILWQVRKSGYLEPHHLVGFGPLMAVALAGLGAGLLPGRPAWLPWVGAALALCPWAVMQVKEVHGPAEPLQGFINAHLLDLADLAGPIREQAVREGRWPVVFTWLPRDPPESGDVITQVLGEFARWGYDPRGHRPTCWLVARPTDLPAPGSIEVAGLAAVQDVDCTALAGWAPRLCDEQAPNTLRYRRPGREADPVLELMPCRPGPRGTQRPPQ